MSTRIAWSGLVLAGLTLTTPQFASAEGPECSGAYEYDDECEVAESCRCRRPSRIKIVIKRPLFLSSPFHLPPPPPTGFATASVPAVMVPTFAVPATPAVAVTAAAQPALSNEQLRQIAEMLRQPTTTAGAVAAPARATAAGCAPAATAAGAAGSLTCPDPCADILQLKRDVADLIVVTNRLTDAVQTLAKQSKNQPQGKTE